MENLTVFWGVLLTIAAAISALGGAWKYIKELKKPYEELKNRVLELEKQNERSKQNLESLEERLKRYMDEQNSSTNETIHNIKEDIKVLRDSIEANEKDTKLILKEIFHLSNYVASGDEVKLRELIKVNDEILNHVIDEK